MIRDEFEYSARAPASGPARRLVVLFHGYGVNASFMDKMAEEIAREIPDALIVCPQASDVMNLPPPERYAELTLPPPAEATAPPAGLDPAAQRQWFAITLTPAQMHEALMDLAERLNRFIDRQRDALGITEQDIAIMGFSQGGAVAVYTACTRSRQIACVVGHSTVIMDTADFTAKPPALVIYGMDDKSFTEHDYQTRTVQPLMGFLPDFQVKIYKDLGHRTSAASRKAAADYIKSRLMGPHSGPG